MSTPAAEQYPAAPGRIAAPRCARSVIDLEREPPPLRESASAGFTLIEILVAFTIAAVLLGALYQLFSTGLRSSAAAESYETAVLLAESGLDALAGTTPAVGETDYRIGRFERHTTVRRRPDLLSTGSLSVPVPYEIRVRVSWRDGVRDRSLTLSSLRPGPQEATR